MAGTAMASIGTHERPPLRRVSANGRPVAARVREVGKWDIEGSRSGVERLFIGQNQRPL
jgi:hypothetical protein